MPIFFSILFRKIFVWGFVFRSVLPCRGLTLALYMAIQSDYRDEIIALLTGATEPLQLIEISKQLRVRADGEDDEMLRHMLQKLVDENLVEKMSRRRFRIRPQDSHGFEGVITFYHNRATVQTTDEAFPIIHIDRQNLYTALDGDIVRVKPHAVRTGQKIKGEVVDIVERSSQLISGTIELEGNFYYLVPDEAKYYIDFIVAEKNLKGAKHSDKVIAKFLQWKHPNSSPEVEVSEIVGKSGNAAVEFEAIVKEFDLPIGFTDAVEREAAAFSEPSARAPRGRVDLTAETIITIDPDDARDFDDALSINDLANGNLELGVHIADVSAYVTEGSAIDNEAMARGNSTYLADRVVPMLPEHLSNNICSLVPNKHRFAFSVFMEFDPQGVVRNYRIHESLIKSVRRFTYDEALQIIETGQGEFAVEVLRLHKLSQVLYRNRMKQGGIDFETQEIKFQLDEFKQPISASVKSRTESTSLVEECMLAANKTVAEHVNSLKKIWGTKKAPALVYRVHETPNVEKLTDAVSVIRALGFDVPSGKLGPREINAIIAQAHNRAEKPVINSLLLRSMAKAIYSEFNVGHFGLGFEEYAHFTSPIRRYPDLIVHRAIKEYALGKPDPKRWNDLYQQAEEVSSQCSITERKSVEAERASNKLAQTILASEHLAEEFNGRITGITGFGVFVLLEGLYCEGLLHIKDIKDDYYFFDERKFRLVGRKRGRTFQFGTMVKVKIVRADIKKRMVDLHLADIPLDETEPKKTGEERTDDRPKKISHSGGKSEPRSGGGKSEPRSGGGKSEPRSGGGKSEPRGGSGKSTPSGGSNSAPSASGKKHGGGKKRSTNKGKPNRKPPA
ncbi:MAG: ribonuclease R [Ignavibacteria bacterium]|nr:ribonuclease R [Ignavibacteria bacterium]